MFNDQQLSVATIRLTHLTRRLSAGQAAIDPHVFEEHLRAIRYIERQVGGTRKHLGNMANTRGRGPVQVHKSSINVSRGHISRLEKALAKYLGALVARAPNRPRTWKGVVVCVPGETKSIHAEVFQGKGVLNVVQKTMKQLDSSQFTAVVRHDLQNGQSFITQAQPQQLDAVSGLLILIAALLETLRMQGFLRRAA